MHAHKALWREPTWRRELRSGAAMLWEERWHPLREEWIIVAAHRQNRPWHGASVAGTAAAPPRHSPDCHLCPGNLRISGQHNPSYAGVHVFDNDHPCVGPAAPLPTEAPGIYRNRRANGHARVICFSPRHDLTLAQMSPGEIAEVVATWGQEHRELGARPEIACVLAFENKGDIVGVSNPHPHGQVYATNFVFNSIAIEAAASERHQRDTGRPLFQDILRAECGDGTRVVAETERAIAFIPWFARYAYEVYVAPKRTCGSFAELTSAEHDDLAETLRQVTVRYDNLWQLSFPYVMVVHQAPTDGGSYGAYHAHVQFHPPLRKPNLLKYLGGPETGGGNFLSDTAPDEKAAELRAQPIVHYTRDPQRAS